MDPSPAPSQPHSQSKPRWFPIRTAHLLLREFVPDDEAPIHEYASDPLVTEHMGWGPNTPEVTRTVLLEHIERQQTWPRPIVSLAIEHSADRKMIGGISLRIGGVPGQPVGSSPEWGGGDKTADIGYVINRHYWSRGYCTEAVRAVLDAAFNHIGLHRVWAGCDVKNPGSYRVMEKLGMRREAHFLQDVLQKGEWRDSYLYAITAEEWKQRRLSPSP